MDTQETKKTQEADNLDFLKEMADGIVDAILEPEGKDKKPEKPEMKNITPDEEKPKSSIWDEESEALDAFEQAKKDIDETIEEGREKMAEAQNVTIDNESGEVLQDRFAKEFTTRQEANNLLDLLDSLGYEDNYETGKGGKQVILTGITPEDLNLIQRKANIKLWSDRTQAVAKAVTTFATDVADYALNGALAPTAGAVVNAGMTTGRVVATAAVSVGAATLATTIRNGRAAVRELSRNKDVKDAWSEVKGLGSDIGGLLFGSKGGSDSDWRAVG